MLQRLSNGIDTFTEWVGVITSWLVPLMVVLGSWNVFGRFAGQEIGQNLTANALIEGQWYLYDLVFLLGAAYALKHNAHVRVDVLYSRWSSRRKALVNILGTLFFLIPFCIFVIVASWGFVMASWSILEQSSDGSFPGGLPRYPIKTMIIVGYSLLIVQGLSELIKSILILTDSAHVSQEAE